MIDLDDIKKRIPKYGAGDIKALVEEVERLRGERAAVVAHLRAQAEMAYDNTDAHHALWLAADEIERGEHRREEEG
jgi:hypothetical protein